MESLAHQGNPVSFLLDSHRGGTGQELGRRYPFVLVRGDNPGLHGGVDGGDGHAQVKSILGGPFAGALLLGRIEDNLHQGLARVRVLLPQDLAGDLHEITAELTGVPAVDHLGQLGGRIPQPPGEEIVDLGQQLHDAVLDAVVHHFHIVPGPARANISAARFAVDLGRDPGKDRLQGSVGFLLAAGHDAGPFQRPFLTAGNPRTDIVDPGALKVRRPALRIAEK